MIDVSGVRLVNVLPVDDAFERLRNAPLEAAGDEEIFLYRYARMRIADIVPDEVNPTSLYVMRDLLETQRALREHLLAEYEIDTLRLTKVLHLETKNGPLGMAPPVVEIYEENVRILPRPGERTPPDLRIRIPILKDGIHRGFLARELGVTLSCVLIHGASDSVRPYAYPNHWSDVRIYDAKPEVKKYYRREVPYSFMRPLKVLRQIGDGPVQAQWNR